MIKSLSHKKVIMFLAILALAGILAFVVKTQQNKEFDYVKTTNIRLALQEQFERNERLVKTESQKMYFNVR